MNSWRTGRWRQALRPDVDLAEAEGLAAGTGLLTGSVAHAQHRTATVRPCPVCDGTAEIVVVDLLARASTHRCRTCDHRWTLADDALDPSTAERAAESTV